MSVDLCFPVACRSFQNTEVVRDQQPNEHSKLVLRGTLGYLMHSGRHRSWFLSRISIAKINHCNHRWGFSGPAQLGLCLPGLQAIHPRLGTMRVDTAVCFLLAGLSLWLLQGSDLKRWKRTSSRICAFAVGLFSLLSLGERWLDWEVRIDDFFFTIFASYMSVPGSMPALSALMFLVLGLALQ